MGVPSESRPTGTRSSSESVLVLQGVEEIVAAPTPQEAVDRAAAVAARLAGYGAALLTVTFPCGTQVGSVGLTPGEEDRFRSQVDRVSAAERRANRERMRKLAWEGTDIVYVPGAARSAEWNVVATDPERESAAGEWQPSDALYVLVGDPDGADCGVLSLDQPLDGRAPSPAESDRLRLASRLLRVVVPILQSRVASTRAEVAERQAWRAQRSEVIGELAMHVAHDLNNLLMVIRGQAEVLHLDEDAPREHGLQVIMDTCDRAGALTRRVLGMARDTGGNEAFDVGGTVRELETMLRRLVAPGCTLAVEAEARPLRVKMVTADLLQVLLNLVVNARDAMPKGGAVTVRVRAVDENVTAFVRIEVLDQGPGVPAGVRERVFDPFFTTRPGGTGLGLSTVAGIVRRGGGRVRLAPDEGRGACFVVDLPRVD